MHKNHNVIPLRCRSGIMLTSRSRRISQPYSWAELEISKGAAQALFTHLDISPGFWAVLKLFGSKENAERESMGGFNEEFWSDNDASFGKSLSLVHRSHSMLAQLTVSKISLIQQSTSKSTVDQMFMILGQSDKPACTINIMLQRMRIYSFY
jgi:hypothetical protein